MVPPQERPTFQAVSSATPNSRVLGLPLSITSSASVTTAPSTQPPDTEPRKSPSSSMPRFEPTGRGAEPQVSTTVASATPRPFFFQSSAACRMSSSRANIFVISSRGIQSGAAAKQRRVTLQYGYATFSNQALGSPAPPPGAERPRTSSAVESRLRIGPNSPTGGSIGRIPLALSSQPAY